MPLLRQFNKMVLTLHVVAEAYLTDNKHEHQAHIWLYLMSKAVGDSGWL